MCMALVTITTTMNSTQQQEEAQVQCTKIKKRPHPTTTMRKIVQFRDEQHLNEVIPSPSPLDHAEFFHTAPVRQPQQPVHPQYQYQQQQAVGGGGGRSTNSTIWYNLNDLERMRHEARDRCRKMRDDEMTRMRLVRMAVSSTTRGLEQRICLERQRRKYLATKCIVKAQTKLDDTKLADLSRRCTAWATDLAVEEAARDYRRAYYCQCNCDYNDDCCCIDIPLESPFLNEPHHQQQQRATAATTPPPCPVVAAAAATTASTAAVVDNSDNPKKRPSPRSSPVVPVAMQQQPTGPAAAAVQVAYASTVGIEQDRRVRARLVQTATSNVIPV